MSVPSITIEPCSGRSRPINDLRNTDLPVPDGPSRAETSPAGNINVTSCQILCEPKDLVSPSTETSTPMFLLLQKFSVLRTGGPGTKFSVGDIRRQDMSIGPANVDLPQVGGYRVQQGADRCGRYLPLNPAAGPQDLVAIAVPTRGAGQQRPTRLVEVDGERVPGLGRRTFRDAVVAIPDPAVLIEIVLRLRSQRPDEGVDHRHEGIDVGRVLEEEHL